MSSTGPYLYDDRPESLHTGTGRSRRGLLSALLIGTVAVAVLLGVLLPVVTGSATGKATEVTGVFLKALAAKDTETAYGLLCDSERQRLRPGQVAGAYLGAGPGRVGAAARTARGETVDVHWADGSASRYTLVNQGGPHICGTTPLG